MGIATKLKEYFFDVYKGQELNKKALTGEFAFQNGTFIPINNTGDYTSNITAVTAYNKIPVLYKIVTTIAELMSEASIEQKERKEGGQEVEYTDFLNLLEEPNPYQSQSDFIIELGTYMMLRGEFYIYTEKGLIGNSNIYMWSIPPEQITKVNEEFYSVYGQQIPKEQIYHYRDIVPGFMPYADAVALSPLSVAGTQLGIVDFATASSQKVLKNGGVPGVAWIDQTPGTIPTTPETIKDIRDEMAKRYNNSYTYGEVQFMTDKVGYTAFGLNPNDLKILENIEFSEARIAHVYKYPLLLLSDKSGSLGSNERKEASKELLVNAVFPKLKRICGVLTKILNDKNYYITFDKDEYPEMQTDWKLNAEALQKIGCLTINEQRKILDYEPLPDPLYDTLFIKTGFVTADEFVNGGTSTADVLPNQGDF